jgi:hypothetical protein
MAVVKTFAMDSEVAVIGFARNATKHPDAFVVVNLGNDKKVAVKVIGAGSDSFGVFRTSDEKDRYEQIGRATLENDLIVYNAPAQSTTAFFAQ